MCCRDSQDILFQASCWCFAFTKDSDNIIEILRCQYIRGLRVQHYCYPTHTRSPGPLPVPDPYSKLRPDPYPRIYPYPSLSSLTTHSLCSYQANRLETRHSVIV